MYTIYKLTIASLKMFVRSRQALFFTLFMPFIIMLVFGYIGFDKPQLSDVGIVTHSPAASTQQFIDQVSKFPTLTIHTGTLEEEQEQLDEGNRSVVLDIPDTISGTGASPITAYVNAGKAAEAAGVLSVLNQFISQATIAAANIQPIATISEQEVNAHNLRYIEFLLPGLIALSIMQMSVFSVAFLFTQYKEKGVLKRILASPMKPFQFVASNAITRLIVSVAQAAIFIIAGLVLFQVHIVGSYILLALCVVLGALMFLGLGFTISGISKTVDSVPAIANLVVFPQLFLGGTFFAISSMPGWLQAVAQFLPLTYFSTALREIMTKGTGLAGIWPDVLGMVVWGVVLIALATVTFRFQEREAA
ncbi:MAG TPA: ABC transporter permease [Candidatus Paceibacterota bacterium]|nr:ABC transporter permease [Candidatus Paceibacterota bacterium]